jgi:RNA polymerase sigma-70 factor (ECF subfamily)
MDRDLVEAARKRDREAYADLIRVRGDRLYALAQRILRDVDRAADALQDALVIAWRDLPGLRDPDRFDAWLHRLVVRSCLAEAKRERYRITNLRHLPAQQRALLVLHHFEGRDDIEIAEILGIPGGTVRSRLHHAHRAMRAALDADARLIAIAGRSA